MALLNDVLTWSQTELRPWQRDAMRRLFTAPKGVLSQQDMDGLYALLKAAHGLPHPSGEVPVPLAPEHLPANPATADPVILKSMHSTKNLNRLAAGQVLEFSKNGLTSIYGGNGTGKSGYGRGLKRACRARDSEMVHADASRPTALTDVPEANFDVEDAGVTKTVAWKRGAIPPEELSTIAVFDSHCARVYLTAEQEAAFAPFGLNMVEDLGNKVLPALADRLAAEIRGINVDTKPFAHLSGSTKVGKLIAALSHKTVIEEVKRLATLNPQETQRLTELERLLSEADPKALAATTRTQAKRLAELEERLYKSYNWVKDESVARLRTLVDAAITTGEAERVVAENFRAGETLLPGTGELVWRALFDAAKRYSEEVAYKGRAFPHIEDAQCVLCQQPLVDGAGRLSRFDSYIKADAAKAAQQARNTLAESLTKIVGAALAVDVADSVKNELEALDSGLPALIDAFDASILSRRTAMLESAKSNDWTRLPALAADPRHKLRDHASQLQATATTLDNAADAATRKALEEERDELRARHQLSLVLSAVVELVGRMQLKNRLEACEADLKTRRITEKSKEFATVGVNQALAAALDDEFAKLGIGHIKTKLIPRGGKGKNKYRLGLALPTAVDLDQILSEGEQRAIAIGSFLAELRQANHKGGIIFDDPVSSLDHWRRHKVAERLVAEARERQVIVFTHDTVFLMMLFDAAKEAGIDHLTQNLECRSDVPGYVSDGMPWDHQPYDARIKVLKAKQQAMLATWPASNPSAANTAEMREQYSLLRSTIERVIQDHVLYGVVRRHQDQVIVNSLRKVVSLEAAEQAEYARLYKRCHKVTSAHDPSTGQNVPVPSAAEFGQDIEALETVMGVTKTRHGTLP